MKGDKFMKGRKSGDLTAEKLGLYVIAAITVAVLFYVFLIQEEGGLLKLGRNVETLKDYFPDFTKNLEAEELPATQTQLPQEHLIAIRSLKNAINATLLSSKADCFTEYGKLPDLGDRQTSIEFRYENGKTTMLVYGGVDGRKLIPELGAEFENMIPCVIAGSDEVAENFFTKYIQKEETAGSYFQPVNYIKIFYQTKLVGITCDKGNRVMTLEPTEETLQYDQGPNYLCNNLQDGGIFFSPDNKHICFIPTTRSDRVWIADQHGIRTDYVGGTATGSISLQLSKGELTQC